MSSIPIFAAIYLLYACPARLSYSPPKLKPQSIYPCMHDEVYKPRAAKGPVMHALRKAELELCGVHRYLRNITIPSAFITKSDGQTLKDLFKKNGAAEVDDVYVVLDWNDVLPRAHKVSSQQKHFSYSLVAANGAGAVTAVAWPHGEQVQAPFQRDGCEVGPPAVP